MPFPKPYVARLRRALVGSLLLALAYPVHARAQNPSFAHWMPAETLLYVEWAHASELLDQIKQGGWITLANELTTYSNPEAARKFQELQAGIKLVAGALGREPESVFRALSSGGGAIAVQGQNQLCIALKAESPDFLRKLSETLVDLARQDARAKRRPASIQILPRAGTTVYQIDNQFSYALKGDLLLASTQGEELARMLDRAGGGEGGASLADQPSLRDRITERAPNAYLWGLVSLTRLRELDPNAFRGKPEDEAGSRLLLGPWVDALRSGDWASLQLAPGTDGAWIAQAALHLPPECHDPRFAGFSPAEGQSPAPLLLPDETLLSVSLYRDLEAIWGVLDQLLPPEALPGLAQLDSFAGQFFGGRDFATGVLGALMPHWRFVMLAQNFGENQPEPETKLPGMALVLSLKPGDEEFAIRLQAAFQSFVGLVNLGAAQQKAPPLLLGTEMIDGITIYKSAYLSQNAAGNSGADIRYNFTPSAARIGDSFVLSSSTQTIRALIPLLKQQPSQQPRSPATLLAELNGQALASLIEANRGFLRMRRMLDEGKDRDAAEADVRTLERLARALGRLRIHVAQAHDRVVFEASLTPGSKP